MRLWTLCALTALVSISAVAAPADDYQAGKDLGRAHRDRVVGDIKSGDASKNQPSYNTDPPARSSVRNGTVRSDAQARRTQCASTPDDPECIGSSVATANRPKETIAPSDPVLSGEATARDPSLILNDIGKAYSACRVGDVQMIAPARFAPDSCAIETGTWSTNVCRKTLDVVPEDRFTCTQAAWVATTQGSLWSGLYNKIINTFADVQCDLTRNDGALSFATGACTDCQSAGANQVVTINVASPSPPRGALPTRVATIGIKYGIQVEVFEEGPGCVGTTCTKTLDFMVGSFQWDEATQQNVYVSPGFTWSYACPAGSYHGPDVVYLQIVCDANGCSQVQQTGAAGVCYVPGDPMAQGTVLTITPGGYYAPGPAATVSGYSPNAPGGWGRITLNFTKPQFLRKAGDYWSDECEPFARRAASTKQPPDGMTVPISLVIPSTNADQCHRISSVCLDGPSTKVIDGIAVTRPCWQFENRFDCAALQPTSNCDLPRFRNCGPTGPSSCLAVDGGIPPHCLSVSTNLECKVSDPVYAPVADCGTTTFCDDGSCNTTTYAGDADFARSVAMLEAAKESGKTLDIQDLRVFKGAAGVCENWPTRCCSTDPTDIGSQCQGDDKDIATNRQGGRCHEVEAGWCASRSLGVCVRRMNTYCCFSSKLSRIINEQGRAQLGRGWGDGRNPDCAGFSVNDIALLDFSKMDFSEFIADIKPTLPDPATVQQQSGEKSGSCYYGEGKC